MAISDRNGAAPEMETPLIAQVHISVRTLVEFVLRHGNIDNSHKSSSGPEVMLEGANIHRMIQRRMGASYHAEYYLRHIIKRIDYEIVIDGRADGIIIPPEWEPFVSDFDEFDSNEGLPEGDEDIQAGDASKVLDVEDENLRNEAAAVIDKLLIAAGQLPSEASSDIDDVPDTKKPRKKIVIDEIKTTYRELEHIKEPEPVHLAQAKCYAYIFALQNNLQDISVRMTYCNTETHEMRYFDSDYTFEEISGWFDEVVRMYTRWADFEVTWKVLRNNSIDAMKFPYEYRKGQKELVAQVFNAIEKKERLFVMAPTGVGKTLANLYPSLKALAMGRAEKLFYLTAKTITRAVASDTLNLLRNQDMRVKSVTLTAKEKICPLDKVECNPGKCPYAKGHFDRINEAMYDLLTHSDEFSRERIIEYSEKHMVCPFEFSLDMSLFSDVVICDYNYVFDPNAYLRRFFGEGNRGDYLFLVDEAHNLTDRAMSMYSAELVKENFLIVKSLVKDADPKLARAIEACNKDMLSYKRECDEVLVVDDFEMLVAHLLRLSARIEQFMDDNEHFDRMDDVLNMYFEIRHFLNIYENMNEKDYVLFTKHESNGDFVVRLMCANPADWIRKCTDKARFTVFFSATLLPISYYRKMLGAAETDKAVYAQSVFDPGKRALLVARDVTSKYTRRSESEYDRMAEYISEITGVRSGNYIVFFPSFAMLEQVYELFMCRYFKPDEQEVILQTVSMTERDREDFISRFSDGEGKTSEISEGALIETEVSRPDTLIGFCVLGGIFSEGIDLKNDALIGAVIIGTGLPMVCAERELLKRRYSEMGLDGFAYAYRYPGMNKVQQAAGRVIRTADDKGVVALLDERFLGRDYLSLFPREWENYKTCRVFDVSEYLNEFWG